MKRTPTVFGCFLVPTLVLFCWALIVLCPAIAFAWDGDQEFSIGFSRSLFTDVNENDAKAAIKVWSQTVARARNIKANTTTQLFGMVEEMKNALKSGSVDAMGMTFEEYMAVSTEVETEHWFLTQIAGNLYEEYVLLTQDIVGIEVIKKVPKRYLIFHDTARTSLAMHWLKSARMEQNFAENMKAYFTSVKRVKKLSAAVLPVFFGQADACLVTHSGFSMMAELNPQIGRKLRIVAKSIPLVPALMCFRKNFNSPQKKRILIALKELHTSSAGQQVLTIFQAEALVEVDFKALEGTINFLKK